MTATQGQREKAEAFRRLHHGGQILVLANSSDVATSKLVEQAGFPAVATSSAGICWTLGYADGGFIPRSEMLGMVARIAGSVEVPVTADLEAGYGVEPATVAETAELAVAAGAVGMNLEDSREGSVLAFDLSVERVAAARDGAKRTGVDLVLNARTDCFLRSGSGPEVFAETLRRAHAYRSAGADCIFIPGVRDEETIGALAAEIDAPVNILADSQSPPIARLEELGVARVSIGDLFSLLAATRVKAALVELLESGTYGFGDGVGGYDEINRLLS